jgi:ABC-type multidrug transport system permease subunit
LLLLVLALPLAFVAITAFGYNSPMLVTHPLLVLETGSPGEPLIETLGAQRYADGRPIFAITATADLETAEAALKAQTATALVRLSADASTIFIKGDALYPPFYRAGVILESVINDYADRLAHRPELVRIVEQPLGAAGPQTEFDLYAPGMMIFALLLIIPQTAMLVAREIRWGTLTRLRLTRLRAWDFLGGISLAQMAVAVAQVVIIFASALLLGFHNQGSLGLALLVGLAVSFSAIGLGLVVACFVQNDSQAINVGSTVTMLQVFMSGSFFALPPLTVFTLAGHQIDLFDVFPATHGFLALQQVLSYGAGLHQIAFRLGATLILSGLYFGLGVVFFQRLKMQDSG